MYNLIYTHLGTENDYFCRIGGAGCCTSRNSGDHFWIFEQESPPVWELFYEVDLGNVCEIGLRPHNLFSACDVERGHAV